MRETFSVTDDGYRLAPSKALALARKIEPALRSRSAGAWAPLRDAPRRPPARVSRTICTRRFRARTGLLAPHAGHWYGPPSRRRTETAIRCMGLVEEMDSKALFVQTLVDNSQAFG